MAAPQLLSRAPSQVPEVPLLEAGDHLDQKTFHARYEAMPSHCRAELIEGIVYMPSPLKANHGKIHVEVLVWLAMYKVATPGTYALDNTTAILGPASEPQPDAALLILRECGGQTREDEEGYLVGPPELVVEVASSSVSYDLHSKRREYERAGVREYLVLILDEERAVWFARRAEGFVPLTPGDDGLWRSEMFPGLWLDAPALFRCDTRRVQDVLQQGLASAEHGGFVESLKRG